MRLRVQSSDEAVLDRLVGMGVQRVVPDLASRSLDVAKGFYADVLRLATVMDHGWIVILADPNHPNAQISLMTHDETNSRRPGRFDPGE